MLKTVVIGNESWEAVLVQVLVDNAKEVILWGRNPRGIDGISLWHQNTRFFPDATLYKNPKVICDLNVTRDADFFVLSVPITAVEGLCIKIGALAEKLVVVVSISEGFHPQTNERISNVIRRFTPEDKLKNVVSLISPSHAEEVILRMLTTICAVSLCEEDACSMQELFSNEYLRVHRGDDEVGSKIDVALKSAIVVASGMLSGIDYDDNTKAALVTRGLTEMIHYDVAPGGRTGTFMGLTGIGDPIVTHANIHPRNFRAGYETGTCNGARHFWESNTKTVEGVHTVKVVYEVAEQKQIDMPIVGEIYRVSYEDRKPRQSTKDLMLRDLKHETRQ